MGELLGDGCDLALTDERTHALASPALLTSPGSPQDGELREDVRDNTQLAQSWPLHQVLTLTVRQAVGLKASVSTSAVAHPTHSVSTMTGLERRSSVFAARTTRIEHGPVQFKTHNTQTDQASSRGPFLPLRSVRRFQLAPPPKHLRAGTERSSCTGGPED